MPRLLQINVTANRGSTGKIAESIGLSAMNAGWESFVAYGRRSNPSQSQIIKIGDSFDKYFHYAEQRIRDNEGLCSRSATKRLIRQIDEIKPDVIQLHNIHDHYLNYRLLFNYLNRTDIPVVWTFHDCWAFTGHCFHFERQNCMRWKSKCYDCPMKRISPKTFLDRSTMNYSLKKSLFTANKNLHIVPVSEWIADLTRESFLGGKDIRVIHNGVDVSLFKPSFQIRNEKIRILGVSGVWTKSKGIYDFYRLREILDIDRYEIVLVGLSQKQINNLPSGIIGIEHTESVQELASLYCSAHIFFNPTYADTFPTVNLEALACGTPVLTYRTGGSPEAVTPDTGWVVEQGDIESVESIIRSFAAKEEFEVTANRLNCRERAVSLFDKEKCFNNYIKLYNELIQ